MHVSCIEHTFIRSKKGKIICFELNEQFRHVLNGVCKENDLKDTLEIRKDIENYCDITAEVINEDIDVIFAEPSFGIRCEYFAKNWKLFRNQKKNSEFFPSFKT